MLDTNEKLLKLKNIIQKYKSLAVGFSGGVDSAYLLYVTNQVLGNNCLAITASLMSGTKDELERTESFCKVWTIRYKCLPINELNIDGFVKNPPDRCYICKKEIFRVIKEEALKEGISYVADGSNSDDLSDYRPGMKALKELDIVSPLMEAGLTKEEIRRLSKEANLPTWNLPSSPCLSSRIPYGEIITKEKLSMIKQSESFLKSIGFSNCRVRTHGKLARIEIDNNQFNKIFEKDTKDSVISKLKEIGYTYISLDLSGFKSGSLNDAL